jgi:hypothetical protein
MWDFEWSAEQAHGRQIQIGAGNVTGLNAMPRSVASDGINVEAPLWLLMARVFPSQLEADSGGK